jgi:hypothetical protein
MKALLKQAEQAWKAIAHNLTLTHPELPNAASQIAQRIVLVTLCLTICENRGIVAPGQLQQISQQTDLYARLTQYWYSVGLSSFLIDPQQLHPDVADYLLRDLFSRFAQSVSGNTVPIQALGQLHEMFLDKEISPGARLPKVGRRKSAGAYYTPEAIAHYITQNTVGHLLNSCPEGEQTPLQILDPACGGGIFLLTAYQVLLEHKLDHQGTLTQAERSQILLNHLYGVDLDPQAVEVTQLSLLLKLLESLPHPDLSQLPDLSSNIQVGNAIIGEAPQPHKALQQEALYPLDWQTAFPQAMQSGGFEVVIGNPPYIDSETMTRSLPHCRHYCTTHYEAAAGNWDLFCVFIEKALQLCKPGGLSSLIVPNKLLSADYAAGARSLLQHHQLLSIRDYSRVSVFAVAVYPLVYVVQKATPSTGSTLRYEFMQSVKEVAYSHVVPQAIEFDPSSPNPLDSKQSFVRGSSPWLITLEPQQADLILRLQQFPALGAIAQVTGAATVAEAYAIQSLIQESQTPTPEDLCLVNSGTLDRYCLLWGKKRLRYLGASYLHPVIPAHLRQHLPRKREQQAIAPKIVVAGMTKQLECALDATGKVLAAKSTSIIQSAIDLRYLLGILNSKLIHFYFINSFASNSLSGGYLRVGPPQLKQIPIYWGNGQWGNGENGENGDDRPSQLIHLVEQMLLISAQQEFAKPSELQEFNNLINAIEQQIDQLVCKLYGLTTAEAEMVLAFPSRERSFVQ